MTKRKTTSKVAATRTVLAKALGVSRQMVAKYIARDDWSLGSSGPWSVEAVEQWRRTTLRCNGAADPESARLRRELLRQRTRKLEQYNADQADRWIDRDEAREELRVYVALVREALMDAARRLPEEFEARWLLREGRRAEVAQIVETVFREIVDQFARSMEQITER